MLKLSDTRFLMGSWLVLLALFVAVLAIARSDLAVLGGGVGALLAVAGLGTAGCAVAGIAQAPTVGWTAPAILLGSVLGIAAVALVAAGLFGWTPVLQPLANVMAWPMDTTPAGRIALVGLAGVIAVKWLVAAGMALVTR